MGRVSILSALLAAALLLTAVAWQRSAEYDEQYTLFLTGQAARPEWPPTVITAAEVRAYQATQAGVATIAGELRTTDVHPPLYFWAVAAWRRLVGGSLFAVRLGSVMCSVVTLGFVAAIAQSAGIPPLPAVLLTVGCYGFTYTGGLARGFALAQMLGVAGVALLVGRRSPRRALAAGILLGGAMFANYLAGFVGWAVLAWLAAFSPGGEWRARIKSSACCLAGFAAWLPAVLWFLLAQRDSRIGQFAPFEPVGAVTRLAQYAAANLFGGLPLYVEGGARTALAGGLAILLVGLAAQITRRWSVIATPEVRGLLLLAALAPPVGLLSLGFVFDNTPIELRYLTFATPFVGLLLAAALPPMARNAVLAVQAVALFGLMTRPETMQPARDAARTAAALAQDGVVLLPYGNDGVGIVGAFAVEAPPELRLLVIRRDASPQAIRALVGEEPRAVLVLLGQDEASRTTAQAMRAAFAVPEWQVAGKASNVIVFQKVGSPNG